MDGGKRILEAVGLIGLASLAIWAGLERNYVLLAALGGTTALYLVQRRAAR
jgi:hypothetical protein